MRYVRFIDLIVKNRFVYCNTILFVYVKLVKAYLECFYFILFIEVIIPFWCISKWLT